MEMKIELISEEMIKPSSPTPPNLRHFNFSFLDQLTPDVYNPMVYFYSDPPNPTKLKTSLSRVLTQFYPLAGRVNSPTSILCNDSGIPFSLTKLNCPQSDVVRTPSPSLLNQLLPFQLDHLSDVSFGVRLNVFQCGGIAIGVCVSHKIGDAMSFLAVVNEWAAVCRGEGGGVRRRFEAAEIFPAREMGLYNTRNSLCRERVARRYEIDACKVEDIRKKYAESDALENQRRPSRIEALSAFLYSRFLAAIKKDVSSSGDNGNSGSEKTHLVCHAVNIRSKLDPPLPENAFGNYYRASMVVPSKEILNDEYCYALVTKVREEISKINLQFLEQFKKLDDNLLETMKDRSKRFAAGELISCAFTSLCRMPIYEADFGWGKPVWAGSPALVFKNLFVFADKEDGDGIEVYVHLKEEDMERFEADKEFLSYFESSSSGGVSVD